MTVCRRHACHTKVHPHALEFPAKAKTVSRNVSKMPQTMETKISFGFEAISISSQVGVSEI
jgi:hypothetical protein